MAKEKKQLVWQKQPESIWEKSFDVQESSDNQPRPILMEAQSIGTQKSAPTQLSPGENSISDWHNPFLRNLLKSHNLNL